MDCKNFELTASAYLDRQLDESETGEYRAHLAGCGECRLLLVEIEATSLMLRSVERPEVPRELRSYVMTEVARNASPDFTLAQRLFDWMLKLNPRVVAYSAGLVLSLLSFGSLFSTFRPIPLPTVQADEQVAILPAVSGSDREFHSYNNLPADASQADDEHYYQLPRVLSNSALVSFSHIAYQKPGNETMTALVEVGVDGRGRLVDVIDAPKDPYLVEQLWWSLRSRSFQPALVSGRPVPTKIILLVEKVDISG
jgi:hypothetical protein